MKKLSVSKVVFIFLIFMVSLCGISCGYFVKKESAEIKKLDSLETVIQAIEVKGMQDFEFLNQRIDSLVNLQKIKIPKPTKLSAKKEFEKTAAEDREFIRKGVIDMFDH